MTENPKRKRDDEQDPTEESKKEDYIDDAHPGEDREDAVVDEQGKNLSLLQTHQQTTK